MDEWIVGYQGVRVRYSAVEVKSFTCRVKRTVKIEDVLIGTDHLFYGDVLYVCTVLYMYVLVHCTVQYRIPDGDNMQ